MLSLHLLSTEAPIPVVYSYPALPLRAVYKEALKHAD